MSVNGRLIGKLKRIKPAPIGEDLVAVAMGERTEMTAKRVAEIDKEIRAMIAEALRVRRTVQELEDVPSMIRPGSRVL